MSHLNLKALGNHSVPEQSHATNSSCHQLSFNDINVYKIAAFIHLHKSDYFLSLQGNPSFNCFEGADLKTWCSIAHINSCILTFKKFQFIASAFYHCFISVTSRHYSPDCCRFTEMRIRHLKSGKNKYRWALICYAAVLINGVCLTDVLARSHLHILFQESLLEVIEHILGSFTLQKKRLFGAVKEKW